MLLLTQVQQALEYVTAENEQLRLALAPTIEPEPIRLSVQMDVAGRSVELQLRPADNTDAVVRAFCRQHGLTGERAQRVRISAERAVGTLRVSSAAAAGVAAAPTAASAGGHHRRVTQAHI